MKHQSRYETKGEDNLVKITTFLSSVIKLYKANKQHLDGWSIPLPCLSMQHDVLIYHLIFPYIAILQESKSFEIGSV